VQQITTVILFDCCCVKSKHKNEIAFGSDFSLLPSIYKVKMSQKFLFDLTNN